jgi:hypothetical protein
VGRTSGIEVREAHHCGARGFQSKDIGERNGLRALHASAKPVLFKQLRQHDGDGFVERSSARNAQYGLFGFPSGGKLLFLEDR